MTTTSVAIEAALHAPFDGRQSAALETEVARQGEFLGLEAHVEVRAM